MPFTGSQLSGVRARALLAQRMARDLADVCLASWGVIAQGEWADSLLDCAHIATTTARLLGSSAEDDIPTIAMLVTICRRFAVRCAETCERSARPELTACARAARAAVAAFDDLVALATDPPATAFDDDEITVVTIVLDADDAVA